MEDAAGRELGEGVAPLDREIFERARPHLQTRFNEVHTVVSYAFARRLLETEEGDPKVALPAILLHDVGWSHVPEDQQLTAFGPNPTAPDLTRVHEREGAAMAAEILKELGCPEPLAAEVAEIVAGHDTRLEALGASDAVVKDADKLFRLSKEGFPIDCGRFGLDPAQHLGWLEERVDRWFFTETGRRLARQEIADRRRALEGGARVRLKLAGLPDLSARLGGDEAEVALDCGTLGGLLVWLQRAHGDAAGVRLLGSDGRVDENLQMVRNGTEWLARDRLDLALADGDEVTLLVLVAGG